MENIHSLIFYLKSSVSETGLCLRLQVVHTQLGPIDRAGLSLVRNSVSWAQLSVYNLKAETGFCLRLKVVHTQLGPIDRASLSLVRNSVYWAQLGVYHLKTETESSLQKVAF
jgi:hypothetical protein